MRQVQEALEIYHQSLGRSLSMLREILIGYPERVKLMISESRPYPEDQIELFWNQFNARKTKCKTFEQLCSLIKQEIGDHFL